MIVMALSFPLMAHLLNDSTRWRRLTRDFIVLLGLVSMLTVVTYESDFRQISWRSFFSGRRNPPIWADAFITQMITRNAPANASVGVAFGEDGADYPLFGENFTHKVTRALPEENLLPRADVAQFKHDFENSDLIYAFHYKFPPAADFIQQKFFLLSQDGYNSLWIRSDLRSANECDDDKWPFANFYESSSQAVCPQFPIMLGENGAQAPNGEFAPLVGSAPNEYLKFGFLVKKNAAVTFTIPIYSGNAKSEQTLKLEITGANFQPQIFYAPFTPVKKKSVVNFTIPLAPDMYVIQISISGGDAKSNILQIQVAAE